MAATSGYDTAQEKAVDALLDSRGYANAAITPIKGGVKVEAERRALLHNGRWRLEAVVSETGEVLAVTERDW